MKPVVAIILLFIFNPIFSQNSFFAEHFDEDQLRNLLLDSLNSKRENKQTHHLENDGILEAAAYEQAEYILEQENFEHDQENSKFKTLNDRVEYFGGRYAGLGENIFAVKTEEGRQRRSNRRDNNKLESYSDIVSTLFKAWEDDDESLANIYDIDFHRIGVAVLYDSVNKELAVVSVFGTEPYPIREGLKFRDDEELKSYDRSACDKVLREYPALAELLGSSVKIEENEVWLKDVDKEFINKTISSSSDGLAADIICDDQFPCDGGNRLYPGKIHDGYLMKPVRKFNLTSHLILDKNNEYNLFLGELHPSFENHRCEANVLLIKENSVCAVAPFNHFGGKNITWLNPSYQYSFLNDSIQRYTWQDTLNFTFHSSSDKTNTLKKLDSFLTYFKNVDPEIHSVEAEIYFSPIKAKRETAEKWKTTIQNRLKEYFFPSGQITFSEKVAWDEYQEFVKNRIYSLETKELDSIELASYLVEEYQKENHFKTFMDSLNRINLKIIKKNSWKENTNEHLDKMYNYFLQQRKPELALRVQEKLINENDINVHESIAEKQVPLKKKYSDLANNQLLLQVNAGNFDNSKGKTVKQSFDEILFADPSNSIVQYNLLVATLKEWSTQLKNASGIEDWLKSYNRIKSKAVFQDSSLEKILLNYHILVADHYYENAKYEERKKELKIVGKIISNKKLTEKEANFFAEYLMFQLQLPAAIKLLKSYAQKEKPLESTFKNILSISIYGHEILTERDKLELHQKYSMLYPEGYCQLFSHKNMGIQALKNLDIKKIYCGSCE